MEIKQPDKLVFACDWYYDRRKSWSGTHLSIFNALKREFDVEDFDMGLKTFFRTGLEVLSNKVGLPLHLSAKRQKKMQTVADKKFSGSNANIFQFGAQPDIAGVKSFVYQDLNFPYLEKLCCNDPTVFASSGFARFSLDEIKTHAENQIRFYKKENCARILAMGHWYRDFLLSDPSIPSEKVRYIGGGCNLQESLIDYSKKQGNKILFVGKNFERKNGPLVVSAFRILKKEMPEAELYIVGPKTLKPEGEGIHCVGELGFEGVAQYFNLCDVFCMPSLFEAYGLVFVEALTFGLPCIGRNAYEMPYFIEEGETGYLLRSQSAEELAGLMEQALKNTSVRENVRSRREFYIKEYSWATVAKRVKNIVEEMN